jgi:homoserine O-acetyltransferase
MDVAVPMASTPAEMSGRNWMTRRMIIDTIRNDPEWMNGNYTQQPRSLPARSWCSTGSRPAGATSGSTRPAPTREKADQLLTSA